MVTSTAGKYEQFISSKYAPKGPKPKAERVKVKESYPTSILIAGDMVYTGGWIDPTKEELKGLSQTWRLIGRREDGRKWKKLADMRQGRATHGCVADTYKVFQNNRV